MALEQERERLPEGGLRLFLMGGCSGVRPGLALDEPQESDTIFEQEGLKLIIDPGSIKYLQNAMIDYSEDENGGGFSIDAQGPLPSCGCGRPCGQESAND
jgi:iron-sulfur cluster assembly accessory protein